MWILLPLDGIHALDAMDTSFAHGLAAADVCAAKGGTGQKNELDAQKNQCKSNNSKRRQYQFQHNLLSLRRQSY